MTEVGQPVASTTYRPTEPVDVRFALMGTKSVTSAEGVRWWTTVSPEGPMSVAFRPSADGSIRADAWGDGADWGLTHLPRLLGADDTDAAEFRPGHPLVRRLAAQFESLRIGATGRWFEAVAFGAIGQRVVTADAKTSRKRLAFRYGHHPVGLAPVPAFPGPDVLLRLPDHDFHRAGIDRGRARVIRIAARYSDRIERLGTAAGHDADRWLQQLPGIGPWTAALATSAAGGNADAVPVGDLHIPGMVCRALSGEDGDDARMLELLEPFAGHRQRVVRLVKMAGPGPAPNRPAPTRGDISRL